MTVEIREAVAEDWEAIRPFFREIVAAGETYAYDPEMTDAQGYEAIQFNAVVESNMAAVALWQSLGFEIVGNVPRAFRLPDGTEVGLHVMYRRLD